jgi:uncharacterized membrane protein
MQLFDNFTGLTGGLHFLTRYAHVLFGVTWVGLLYFFNFVQVPAFAEMEAQARSEALRKITSRALWWFRWAAALTMASGIVMWGLAGSDYKLSTSSGLSILFGSILGLTMGGNVWSVIWPKQRINIASAEAVAAGGAADPAAAEAAKRAGRASRVNVFFSIPMLFFMLFTSHFAIYFSDPGSSGWIVAILFVVIWLGAELSALGVLGGLDNPFCEHVLNDHKKTIYAGLAFTAILYFIGWELIIG